MTSQRDEMTGRDAFPESRAAESEDRRTQPPLVSGPDAPMAGEEDVILATEDEPVTGEPGMAGPGPSGTLASEDEVDPSAEPVVPAGRGTSVPASGPAAAPADPDGTAPGEGDVFGAARGVGEPATVPAPAGGVAAEEVTAQAVTGEPAGPAAGEPAAPGGISAAALAEQQWPQIMAMFVDDPRGSVERAATAASEVAAALTASLDREQQRLRSSWQDNTSTEDLRNALQQYRAFCGRLEGLG